MHTGLSLDGWFKNDKVFPFMDQTALNTVKLKTCDHKKFQQRNVATWIPWNSTHIVDTNSTKNIHIKVTLFCKQNMIFAMFAVILNSENQQ